MLGYKRQRCSVLAFNELAFKKDVLRPCEFDGPPLSSEYSQGEKKIFLACPKDFRVVFKRTGSCPSRLALISFAESMLVANTVQRMARVTGFTRPCSSFGKGAEIFAACEDFHAGITA